MKHLRVYMLLFGVLLTLPIGFVAWRTYAALDREAEAQARFFAERLLDGMEAELADLVQKEEARAVDAYGPSSVGVDAPSALAALPREAFILGYFQNNPDGTFQTPLHAGPEGDSAALTQRVARLRAINQLFNVRKTVTRLPGAIPPDIEPPAVVAKKTLPSFEDRYLNAPLASERKNVLGREKSRMEEISVGQALQLGSKERVQRPASVPDADDAAVAAEKQAGDAQADRSPQSSLRWERAAAPEQTAASAAAGDRQPPADRFQAEVAPLQAVAVGGDHIFIFRRVVIGGQIYRQGFALNVAAFMDHLMIRHYAGQPISRYTQLTLSAAGTGTARSSGSAGGQGLTPLATRIFPAPFGFLVADMRAADLPASPARQTLTLALAVLAVVMVAGLVSIYQGTRSVVDLSERRSRFVSAVTHELKTPLTNIRMYIEMLEQGIAATPEREQEYLAILSSESSRLSGLINNVLELSRLEKQTRRFELKNGDLGDVLADVQAIMGETLTREGFALTVEAGDLPTFAYDREVLVQVLINLMENSIKFGRHLVDRRIVIRTGQADGHVAITVSDSGPGIPKRSLKRIFDDFYRVDSELTRTTGGTGIGLALVKKFMLAMGGAVVAENNTGAGCSITITLPVRTQG